MNTFNATPLGRKLSLLELAGLVLVSWLFIWHWGPQIRSYPLPLMAAAYGVVLFYIACLSPVWLHADDRRSWGLGGLKTLFFRTDNAGRALSGFGTITAVGATMIVLAALLKNPDVFLRLDWRIFFLKLSCYAVSGIIQGCITIFILMRLTDLFSSNPFRLSGNDSAEFKGKLAITALVTGYFSLMHTPNVPLMAITGVLTPLLLWQYFKTPHFFLLVGTHAVLGTLLHRVYELPMRIGPFYTNPDRYIIRELFPFVARYIGDSW